MRVLVTSSAMAGHFGPLVPFITALLKRGDDVLVLVPESARTRAAAVGAPVVAGGSPEPATVQGLWRDFQEADPAEASVIANREIFGRLNTEAMLPSVERAVTRHRPQLVLHEATEYAGPTAAMRASIPHAQVAISLAAVEADSLAVAASALEYYGPVPAALQAAPYLTRFPAIVDPSPYRDTRRYREPLPAPSELPDWWNGSTDPLVYVTFGTVTGLAGTGAYQAAAEALAHLPVRVLITTGHELDLGPMPANIQVRRWVDQHDVLASASMVVCHGGSGTTLAALAAGLPMVISPMFADQAHNARALHNLGVARVIAAEGATAAERLTYDPATVPGLRLAIQHVLDSTVMRNTARDIAGRLADRPSPEAVLAHLCA